MILDIPKPEKEISDILFHVENLTVKGDDGLEKVKNVSFSVKKVKFSVLQVLQIMVKRNW